MSIKLKINNKNNNKILLAVEKAGGTSDYNKLKNLPSLNKITLKGEKSFEDLGVTPVTNIEIDEIFKRNI